MSSSYPKRKADLFTAASAPALKKPKKDASLTSFFGAPKGSSASSATVNKSGDPTNGAASDRAQVNQFDKAKWVATLPPEQKSLLKLEIDSLDASWLAYLKDDVTSREFLDLKRFLDREIKSGVKIFPPLEDVYSWSRHTPLHNVRAVILGQDPYHNHNQAHGLCFSVRPPTPAPPSLKNMYTALKNDYPSFRPPANNGGLLTPWAEQGVLMLNTCLTVRAHEANSHAGKGWEAFTQKVIDTVAKVRGRGVVFLAWGSPAAKRVAKINKTKHLVLQSVHPSPLSASRGFFNCGHFKKTNAWLQERYGAEGVIDWSLDTAKPINAPAVKGPIKATDEPKAEGAVAAQTENGTKQSPTTELPLRADDGQPMLRAEDFESDLEDDELKKGQERGDGEDQDALEALQAVAVEEQQLNDVEDKAATHQRSQTLDAEEQAAGENISGG